METTPTRRMMLERPISKPFLKLCEKTDRYLRQNLKETSTEKPHDGSSGTKPDGNTKMSRKLAFGIDLVAFLAPEKSLKMSILQIWLDPGRFRRWRDSLGPLTVFFMNPFGIEVFISEKYLGWHIFLDEQELYFDLEDKEPQLMAEVEIESKPHGDPIIYRVK